MHFTDNQHLLQPSE